MDEELTRFREKWKREIHSNHSLFSSSSSQETGAEKTGSSFSSTQTNTQKSKYKFSRDEHEENRLILLFNDKLQLEAEEKDKTEYEANNDGKKNNKANVFSLPTELILHVLAFLDVRALERSSATCRLWYILSREPSLPQYPDLCFQAWPLTGPDEFRLFGYNWRNMYLKRARVRNDGIYISKNHYLRAGSTEGSYYQPVHEVVYYRYLRFFQDGLVIAALTAEPPKQVVQWFRPLSLLPGGSSGAQKHAVQSGTYSIDGEEVSVWLSMSASYSTHLKLGLSSTGLGKNDRLAVVRYTCRSSRNEETDFNGLEVKKFHFAKLPPHYLAQDHNTSIQSIA